MSMKMFNKFEFDILNLLSNSFSNIGRKNCPGKHCPVFYKRGQGEEGNLLNFKYLGNAQADPPVKICPIVLNLLFKHINLSC